MDSIIRRAIPVMGTVVSVDIRPGRTDPTRLYQALASARSVLHRADAVFSTWKADSPMSRLRRGEITVSDAPHEVTVVLERCEQARDWSGGWFDPWAMPGGVDPTGLVKGWAAGRALEVLVDAGVEAAMVSAGGDVALWGRPGSGRPWRIGIQNPFDRETVVAVAEPVTAIATSGCYERGPHVIDPHTGQPTAKVASASVTGPRIDMADALATALVAGGASAMSRLQELPGYEALVIGHDGSVEQTSGFPEGRPAEAVGIRG